MAKSYIKGGTPIGSTSLCRTCTSAHIMTGYRESEQVTVCDRPSPAIIVPFVIYECSNYYDKNRPSWKQMHDLAIEVSPGPPKSLSGFKTGVGFCESAVPTRTAVDDDEYEDD